MSVQARPTIGVLFETLHGHPRFFIQGSLSKVRPVLPIHLSSLNVSELRFECFAILGGSLPAHRSDSLRSLWLIGAFQLAARETGTVSTHRATTSCVSKLLWTSGVATDARHSVVEEPNSFDIIMATWHYRVVSTMKWARNAHCPSHCIAGRRIYFCLSFSRLDCFLVAGQGSARPTQEIPPEYWPPAATFSIPWKASEIDRIPAWFQMAGSSSFRWIRADFDGFRPVSIRNWEEQALLIDLNQSDRIAVRIEAIRIHIPFLFSSTWSRSN